MAYKEYGATIAPSNVSNTGFPIAMGTHIGGGRIVNNKDTLNSKHWCLLGEGSTLNNQKANAIGQIWYDTLDSKYWKLDSWSGTNPVWVDVSTIFATRSYVDTAIENIPDPMIFKGSLGTGGTITTLPTASGSNTGFTYKVITAGTYAGQVAKVGDTFISDGTTWNLIPSGDDSGGGSVTSITLNATSPILIDNSAAITTSGTRTFSHDSSSGNKHIPSGGSANQILKWSADGTAVWSNEVNTHYTSKNIVSSSAVGTTNTNTTNPYLNHIEESTVTSSHRINGSGATTVNSDLGGNITINSTDTNTTYSFATGTTNGTFNVTPSGGTATPVSIYGLGTAAYTSTYILPLAASGTRGGIQIGYTPTVNNNLPLLLSSEQGYVTLTSASITTGLGYTPYNSTNPNAYTTNTGTVTSITLNATSPILIDNNAAIATSGTRTFSHATTSGNKHIPSGGTTNQLLRWSADGTATWSNEVTYGVFNTTTDGLVPKTTTSNTTDYLRRDGIWVAPPNNNSTTHLYVGASGTNTNGTTTNGNTYIKLFDDTTAREQHKISGNGPSVVTSDATGNIIVGISDNSIGATQLNVTGNGTTTQYLRSDGDGSFTWADISISNVTFNNGGTGDASGTTYNGSTARTISYNTIGAAASSQVDSLVSTVNSKQDKLSILADISLAANVNETIYPVANKVQYIHLTGLSGTNIITLNHFNSLDEFTIIIVNPNSVRIMISHGIGYKYVGVQPSWSYNSWIITIWRGLIFANTINY